MTIVLWKRNEIEVAVNWKLEWAMCDGVLPRHDNGRGGS
jgi:hypothetical protein